MFSIKRVTLLTLLLAISIFFTYTLYSARYTVEKEKMVFAKEELNKELVSSVRHSTQTTLHTHADSAVEKEKIVIAKEELDADLVSSVRQSTQTTLHTHADSGTPQTKPTELSNDVENVPSRNRISPFIKQRQEQRVKDIQRLCTEVFKIQPMSLSGGYTSLRERLQTTFVNDDYKLMVTVVYKTGSEGWKNIFKQLYERGENRSQKAFDSKDGVITLLQVQQKYGWKAVADRLKNYFSFIFVRHPYSRILSAYNSKLVRMPNKFYEKKSRDIIRSVRKIPLPANQKPDLQFYELVKFVANGGWDEHWCPIFNDKKPCHVYYDFIGHLETFQEDAEYLFQLAGIADVVDFPDCGHATGSADLAFLKQSFSQISATLLANLNTRYKNDFKVFGYHLPQNNSDFVYT